MIFSLWLEQYEEDAILGIVGDSENLSQQEKDHLLYRNTKEFSSEIKRKIKNLGVVKSSEDYSNIVSRIDDGIIIKDLVKMISIKFESIQSNTPEAILLQKLVDNGQFLSGDCYISSRRFAMKIDGDYVEGIVLGGYPKRKILHAWVEKDGIVYDPTIPEALSKQEYYKIYNAVAHYRSKGIDATLKSSRENRPGPVAEVPSEFKLKDNIYKLESFRYKLENSEMPYEKGEFVKVGEDPNGYPPSHILYSPQFVWKQNRRSILIDAIRSWKGDPTDMSLHMRDEIENKPISNSGSGKIMRIRAKELLSEVILNSEPAPILYRGDTKSPKSINSPLLGWTSDRKYAFHWAKKYEKLHETKGKVYILRNSKGLNLNRLFGAIDYSEMEWIVENNIPIFYKNKVINS